MFWRKVIGYWKSILIGGLIAYGCLWREPSISLPAVTYADKWVHVLVYMLLTIALLSDSYRAGLGSWRTWLVCVLCSIVYGGFIEILQEQFFYPRTGDWYDWLADVVGVVLGCVIWILVERIINARRVDK